MQSVIFGGGNLGRAIATGLVTRGGPPPRVVGRPTEGPRRAGEFVGIDLAFEASRGDAVVDNVEIALAGGCRQFVIATTGWDDARPALDEVLRSHGATAVAAANFSLGVALFFRIIETAAQLFGRLDGFEPYVIEWHRRDKVDRPSGTALEIASRLLALDPAKSHIAQAAGPPDPAGLELVSVRAGASPGMHLVGFDAAGESIELRLTARDRSAYVAGALAAADWLRREPRPPGLHPFSTVVGDLIATRADVDPPPEVALGASS